MVEKNSLPKILILGGKGLLGSEMARVLTANGYAVKTASHAELDITKGMEVAVWIERLQPEIVINCAALSDVDFCEKNPDLAFKVNAEGVKNICLPLQEIGGRLIHISSDYVFDGKKKSPYVETDLVSPVNIYGKSKLKGEEYVQKILPQSFIVRVQWLYGAHGKNFASQLVRTITTGEVMGPYSLILDRVGTPTPVGVIANVVPRMMTLREGGLFHLSARGGCSWVEFGKAVFEINSRKDFDRWVRAVTEIQNLRLAQRPPYSVLSSDFFERTFQYEFSHWTEALSNVIHYFK
ncbi:MAG: dTDP-4-dehydrorhamnose reductase [Deltaproteobacteria bacterium]|nr:dTDP-4-dehydrorhamnose reductase [Deltaproteobacteria bacterium]